MSTAMPPLPAQLPRSSGRTVVELQPPLIPPPLTQVMPLGSVLSHLEGVVAPTPVPALTKVVKTAQIVPIQVEVRKPTPEEMNEIVSTPVRKDLEPSECVVELPAKQYRVMGKFSTVEWENKVGWDNVMDEFIGKTGELVQVTEEGGVNLGFHAGTIPGQALRETFWFHPHSLELVGAGLTPEIKPCGGASNSIKPALIEIKKRPATTMPKVVTMPVSYLVLGVNHLTDEVELVGAISIREQMFELCCEQIKRNLVRIIGKDRTMCEGSLFNVPVNPALKGVNVACVYELRASFPVESTNIDEEDGRSTGTEVEKIYSWVLIVVATGEPVNFDMLSLAEKL